MIIIYFKRIMDVEKGPKGKKEKKLNKRLFFTSNYGTNRKSCELSKSIYGRSVVSIRVSPSPFLTSAYSINSNFGPLNTLQPECSCDKPKELVYYVLLFWIKNSTERSCGFRTVPVLRRPGDDPDKHFMNFSSSLSLVIMYILQSQNRKRLFEYPVSFSFLPAPLLSHIIWTLWLLLGESLCNRRVSGAVSFGHGGSRGGCCCRSGPRLRNIGPHRQYHAGTLLVACFWLVSQCLACGCRFLLTNLSLHFSLSLPLYLSH